MASTYVQHIQEYLQHMADAREFLYTSILVSVLSDAHSALLGWVQADNGRNTEYQVSLQYESLADVPAVIDPLSETIFRLLSRKHAGKVKIGLLQHEPGTAHAVLVPAYEVDFSAGTPSVDAIRTALRGNTTLHIVLCEDRVDMISPDDLSHFLYFEIAKIIIRADLFKKDNSTMKLVLTLPKMVVSDEVSLVDQETIEINVTPDNIQVSKVDAV